MTRSYASTFPKIFLVCLVVFWSHFAFGKDNSIEQFVKAFQHHNRAKIVSLIEYPLHRQYPLPDITSPQACLAQFNLLFDPEISKKVSQSDPSQDWHDMGSQGVMFQDGLIWFGEESGKLIALNYESAAETAQRKALIAVQKPRLHKSIATFIAPVLDWKSPHYSMRVDRIGATQYRYAVWPIQHSQDQAPDLVLSNGTRTVEGSAGASTLYIFQNGVYTYVCVETQGGEDGKPSRRLRIFKSHRLIMEENCAP